MGSTFNPQILVDKLSKLNSSQQSIETLSHWCIFHMNKAKQVVETWDRQFHCAPCEQRLAFLYLANDILQNSRRKGAEFVAEFWKVLPDSLRNVIENGDEFGRNAALRLISIWEERKVFGSRGQSLKEEFVKRQLGNGDKDREHEGFKLQSPGANALDKLVSGYQAVHSSQLEEGAIFNKCTGAISFFEKVNKDIEGDYGIDELKKQHGILRDCIEKLALLESSRANLVSLLQEALQEQEYKLGQVRDQLQAARMHSELAGGICRRLLGGNGDKQNHTENGGAGNQASQMPGNLMPGAGEQSNSVIYSRQASFAEESGHIKEDPKSAAAAVAAKLAASTSSAQMLSFVLSSLASEGVIGNPIKEPSNKFPSEKKAKIENEHPTCVPQNSQAPAPPFFHSGQLECNLPVTSQQLSPSEPLPPLPPPPSLSPTFPSLPQPMQQYPMPQCLQTAMPLPSAPYGYSMSQHLPAPTHGNYAPVGPPITVVSEFAPPSNAYQSYSPPEGGFYGQPSSMSMAPMNHQ